MLTMNNSTRGKTLADPSSPKRENLFERRHCSANPESSGKPVHPYTKLQNIVTAARSLTESVRCYFPVKGEKWVFEDSSWNDLAKEVGQHLIQLGIIQQDDSTRRPIRL